MALSIGSYGFGLNATVRTAVVRRVGRLVVVRDRLCSQTQQPRFSPDDTDSRVIVPHLSIYTYLYLFLNTHRSERMCVRLLIDLKNE
jgi:hypothetical protein